MYPPQPQEAPSASTELARRLQELRHQGPGTRITRGMLAEAIGASIALISGWESLSHPAVPPARRLLSYATLFATRRSLQDGQLRLLPEEELTDDEIPVRDELYAELLALRTPAREPRLGS